MVVQAAAGTEVDTAAQTLRQNDCVLQAVCFTDLPERVAGQAAMAGYPGEWTKGKDNFGQRIFRTG
jgi:hypothetical protein